MFDSFSMRPWRARRLETMTGDDRSGAAGWPMFELVTADVPPGIPATARERLLKGVPKDLVGTYRVAERATLVAADLVCFGESGPDGRICLEVPGGAVVRVWDHNPSVRRLVNSDLGLFSSCVKAVIERFPFYQQDSELEQWTAAANDIRTIVADIDPPAIADTGFWESFTDDIEMGDYSTEAIVGDDGNYCSDH